MLIRNIEVNQFNIFKIKNKTSFLRAFVDLTFVQENKVFAVYASMHTVCVYGWPAMLLRLIEYQDWSLKIGMADMSCCCTLFSRLCGPIRQNMQYHF